MKWRLVLVTVAAAALVLPLPPGFIERYYSNGLFPGLQSVLTRASNATAFAWFDLFVVIVVVGVVAMCARDARTERAARAVRRIAGRVIVVAAVLYLAFLFTWGLNYRRESLRRKLPYDEARVTEAAAVSLARESVDRLNSLYDPAHASGWAGPGEVDRRLAGAFGDAANALGTSRGIVPGRPKRSLLDLYFRRAGVAGMTDPFFLETMVASDILPFERPHVVAHEWAHLAGYTDEGEANFVGWLACVRGSTAHQYSGWLFLYSEAVGGLRRDAARQASARLASGPRADLQAIRERYAREVSPRLSTAGWRVYDKYLKANRIDAGTASYAEVIQLVLGTGLR